jgi:hypothetical protein
MDEKESMDPAIIKGLFEQGVSLSKPSNTRLSALTIIP